MAGLPVTIFRSTDAGSPIAAPRSIADWFTILKACLVDGYGTKQPLGWTLEFGSIAESKMVFKNKVADGGSGGAVQFDVSPVDSSSLRVTCAGTILGFDTFIKKVGHRLLRPSSNPAHASGWTVIGTSRGFWMMPEAGYDNNGSTNNLGSPTAAQYYMCFFIGDIESVIPNDVNVFTLVTSTKYSATTDSDIVSYEHGFMHYRYNPRVALYATDGSASIVDYDSHLGYSNVDADVASTDRIFDNDIPVVLSPVMLTRTTHTVEHPSVRGTITGLFHNRAFGYRGASVPIILTFGVTDYRMVTGYFAAVFYIKCSGTWYD